MGMHVVTIICEEPGARVGDYTGVSFLAVLPFVPRIGEDILLQDGKRCKVGRVVHKIFTTDEGVVTSGTNVIAYLVPPNQSTSNK